MASIKIAPVSSEENDHLNEIFDNFRRELNERLHKKVVLKFGENFPRIQYNYSLMQLPIPNHSYFEYDKGLANIDNEIDETLIELKKVFFNKEGSFK